MSRPSEVDVRRLSLPVTLAISAAISLSAAWGSVVVTRAHVEDTAKDVTELKSKELPAAVETQHVRDRLDWLERNAEGQNRALERIERHLGTR